MKALAPLPPKASTSSGAPVRSSLLQRKCACGGTPGPTGECTECRQTRLRGKSPFVLNSPQQWHTSTPSVAEALCSPSVPLDGQTRRFMERRFGHSLGHVRVHTDANAAASARAVGAMAYTVGRDVVFQPQHYAPHTPVGRHLLAHELTHVLQQGSSQPLVETAAPRSQRIDITPVGRPMLSRQEIPYPGTIGRCRGMGVPCPAPHFHHGSVCRLVDCQRAATANLPFAISPGICVYHCLDGQVCSCVLLGNATSAVCAFTFCDRAGGIAGESNNETLIARASAAAREQFGGVGGAGAKVAGPRNVQAKLAVGRSDDIYEREAERVADHVMAHDREPTLPLARVTRSRPLIQRQTSTAAADEDVERNEIIKVSKRTGDLEQRAWELVWRLLRRYFPEYSPNVAAVGYDEKEPGARVQIRDIQVKGEKQQSATVTVGKAFVEATTEENLRERIKQLGQSLSGLKALSDAQAGSGGNAIWKLLHENFPKKGGRLAGSSYDAKLPGLRVESKPGEVQAGKAKLAWGAPMLYYGKAFLVLPEADQITKLREQMLKVDKWCVDNARLRKGDLDDEEITTRIRGLSDTALMNLRDNVADTDVRDFAASLLTMSTPLTQGLTRTGTGATTVTFGAVTVIVRPDVNNVQGMVGGATDFTVPAPAAINPTIRQGIVTAFTPPTGLTITIVTRYAQGVKAEGTSGYGAGTTASDKAVGGKSLRVHEGAHGERFMAMIAKANQDSPYPTTFTGTIGDTGQMFQRKVNQYVAAANAFVRTVNAARRQAVRDVDCVGVTIDTFHQQQGQRAAIMCAP
ncbi:MAG: DUF4157 domain-containing protein [Chthoniobacterales bacterium]|nr:DUF4157 domain-containing protein [Chthoniobacterales bacterium]